MHFHAFINSIDANTDATNPKQDGEKRMHQRHSDTVLVVMRERNLGLLSFMIGQCV